MSKERTVGGGIMLLDAIFLIFLVMKLASIGPVGEWSWWWVTAPLWGGLVLIVVATLIVLLLSKIVK